jgi:Tol biopolymer transport system component
MRTWLAATAAGVVLAAVAPAAVTAATAAGGSSTIVVSLDRDGRPGDYDSSDDWFLDISDDGRYVAFESDAPLDQAEDPYATHDVFVRDVVAATTTRVPDVTDGFFYGQAAKPALSADGRLVAWSTDMPVLGEDENTVFDVYLADWAAGTATRASVDRNGDDPNGTATWRFGSYWEDIHDVDVSADGTLVAYTTLADDTGAHDRNRREDVVLRDMVAGTNTVVTLAANGRRGGAISFDLSSDGQTLAFLSDYPFVAGDTNGVADVYVWHRATGSLERASLTDADGQIESEAEYPTISDDGRLVAFSTTSRGLVPGDTSQRADVFVRDLVADTTTWVSSDRGGRVASGESDLGWIAGAGRYVVFRSTSVDLVPGEVSETDDDLDIFRRDLLTGTTVRVSVDVNGGEANGQSLEAAITPDGRWVAFASRANDIVPGVSGSQVYLRDLGSGSGASAGGEGR